MKIFRSLKSGFYRAWKSRKGVLIFWFSLFLLVLALIYPLRGSLSSAFGSSMITEKLADGFDIEVFADLGPTFSSLFSFITAGFMFTYLIGFILNAFFTAGLFGSVRKENGKFSQQEFFGAASKNFWPFLIISLIITGIMYFFCSILLGVPLALTSMSDTMPEKNRVAIMIAACAVTLLLIPVFLLAADYSRAWKATNENESIFKSIGFGFGQTFSKLWSSYIMMILLIFSQIILGILVLLILPAWKPVSGGGVFLLLIISQLLLFARLLLKTWRYASVTSMMEETTKTIPENNKNIKDEQGRSNFIAG